MKYYFHVGACHELPAGAKLPTGAVAIERLPETGERVDPLTGAIALDPALKADMEADPRAVAAAHAQKAIEAALVLSGVPLSHGLLAEEATALGLDLEQLAAAVMDRAAPARAAELARRKLKTGNLEGKTMSSSSAVVGR